MGIKRIQFVSRKKSSEALLNCCATGKEPTITEKTVVQEVIIVVGRRIQERLCFFSGEYFRVPDTDGSFERFKELREHKLFCSSSPFLLKLVIGK